MIFVPTVGLAAIVLVLASVLAGQAAFEQRRQLSLLSTEIRRFEPQAKRADVAAGSAELARGRVQVLDNFKGRTRADLDALQELTKLIQPPAWLTEVTIDRDSVTIGGQAEQAAPLLKLLDSSPFFQNSEFVGQIGRSDKNEVFRIRTMREGIP